MKKLGFTILLGVTVFLPAVARALCPPTLEQQLKTTKSAVTILNQLLVDHHCDQPMTLSARERAYCGRVKQQFDVQLALLIRIVELHRQCEERSGFTRQK